MHPALLREQLRPCAPQPGSSFSSSHSSRSPGLLRPTMSAAYVQNITLHIHNLTLCRGSSNLISLPSEESVSALLLCSIFFFFFFFFLLFAYKQLRAHGFVAWLLQGRAGRLRAGLEAPGSETHRRKTDGKQRVSWADLFLYFCVTWL